MHHTRNIEQRNEGTSGLAEMRRWQSYNIMLHQRVTLYTLIYYLNTYGEIIKEISTEKIKTNTM